MQLPEPGDLVIHDFRQINATTLIAENAPTRPIRVVQWNLERNMRADAILATLARLDADILLLQEIDIGCERSGGRDHMRELCEHLGMLGGFVAEFAELHSPLRVAKDQGGGVHGNAVLSRFPAKFRVVEHPGMEFDWEKDGAGIGEPRRGKRRMIAAEVEIPLEWRGGGSNRIPEVMVCYSVHLEVFSGILGRVREFNGVLTDLEEHYPLHHAHHPQAPSPVIIGGDLNTLGHYAARIPWLSYVKDRYRWLLPPFATEPEFWHRFVLSQHTSHPRDTDMDLHSVPGLAQLGNPGLWDPWDVREDVTLERGPGVSISVHRAEALTPMMRLRLALTVFRRWSGTWFWGKLDWTLVRGVEIVRRESGNTEYLESDHRWILLEVVPEDVPIPDVVTVEDDVMVEQGIVSRDVFGTWHRQWLERRRTANPWYGASFVTSHLRRKAKPESWMDMELSFWRWWAIEHAKVGVGAAVLATLGYVLLRKL